VADPKACRANALRCAELANELKDDGLQTALYEMANNWLKVAAELERLRSHIETRAFGLTAK
jgi:hypothetical protein